MFAFGYCIPAVLILVFYTLMLLGLRKHKQRVTQSSIPLKKISCCTAVLIGFYYICFSPFWIGTLLMTAGSHETRERLGNIMITVQEGAR